MKRFFEKIANSILPELPDLAAYDIENRKQTAVKLQKKDEVKGDVLFGKEWVGEWKEETIFESAAVTNNAPATPNMVILDRFDIAYLDAKFGAEWRKDEGRVKVFKWHWLREDSAATIEKSNTVNGKTKRGYSKRTAADFIRVFYEADDRRESENEPRQRVAPAQANTVEWE